MKIIEFPLVRVSIWFILGIITAQYIQLNSLYCIVFFVTALVLFALTYPKTEKKTHIKKSFALYFLFFTIGVTSIIIHNPSFRKNHYTQNQQNFEKRHQFEVQITDKLKNSEKNQRYIAKLIGIDQQNYIGKIILNISKNTKNTNFNVGAKLMIDDQLVKNFEPNNPDQFDYGNYLKTKGIYAQIYTEISKLKISATLNKDLWYYAAYFRNRITENLSRSGFKKEELAVIMALILGQQQEISSEILRDYQYAGAVHILSVSGLHVGFVLIFIGFILKPIPNTKTGNAFKIAITIFTLWSFAIIAGFSPSVVRSATMFSFLAVGKFINRESNSFHTTIVSLFIILLVEPYFLFDIGFQLSYLAVFFILWLQPVFQKIWHPKNLMIAYFWDIVTISFAAQIGTLPLSIYYFHQFPGLFFITNLLLIPLLGFIIMPFGTILIVFSFFNFIPFILAKLVENSIAWMNKIISWIASLENFIWREIPLNDSLLFVSYLVIILWIIWFQKPTFRKLTLALGSVILLQCLYFFIQWNEQFKAEFIIFNSMKKSIFAEKRGDEIQILSNDNIISGSFEHKMLQTYATANFSILNTPKTTSNHRYFNGQKILIIDQSAVYSITDKPDIVILSHSPKINLERLFIHFKPSIVIADASNYKSYVEIWKASCHKNKIPFHSTYEKGFYKL